MTYPPIPPGMPQVPRAWTSSIGRMRRQLLAVNQRGNFPLLPALCRVYLTVNVSLPSSADVWAASNWSAASDASGMATLAAGSGNSFITIPQSGVYLCYMRSLYTAAIGASTFTSFMTTGGLTESTSVVRGNKDADAYGVDGSVLEASRPIYLTAGTTLYWGYWSRDACTLQGVFNNVPTEVSVTYMGAR